MPSLKEMPMETGVLSENNTVIDFPLTLVRHDGVIYPSETHLSYQGIKPLDQRIHETIEMAVPIRNDFDEE